MMTKLRQVEVMTAQGKTIGQACREAAISEQSDYRWRKEYGGLPIEQAERLKEPEKKSARLMRLGPGLSLEKQVAVEAARRKCGLSERRACRIVGQPRSPQRCVERCGPTKTRGSRPNQTRDKKNVIRPTLATV